MNESELAGIMRGARRRPLWQPGPATRATAYGPELIERILPHRGAMRMLDEITAIDLAQRGLRALRHLAIDDRGFAGHFPGDPVYPAFLQFEIAGQAGICLLDFVNRQSAELTPAETPRRVRLLRAFDARLLAEISPGDTVVALVKLLEHDELTSVIAAQLLKAETVCSCVIVEVCFLDS